MQTDSPILKDIEDKVLVTLSENNMPYSLLGKGSKRYPTSHPASTFPKLQMCTTYEPSSMVAIQTQKNRFSSSATAVR